MRLDQYLVSNKLTVSRARAQEAISVGHVKINGVVAVKSSQKVPEGAIVDYAGDAHGFVSRGGVKLEAMLNTFEINPDRKVCLDLGASTGGFTDVLLRRGALKIYAVDVGHGQLHEKIAGDPRVINLEKTHAKDLSPSLVPVPIDIIVCDVSFISLKKALLPALALTASSARLAALVKPQFEVGREQLGKGGIVKPGFDNNEGVAEDMTTWIAKQQGWKALGYTESPITGGDGNREFVLGAVKTA